MGRSSFGSLKIGSLSSGLPIPKTLNNFGTNEPTNGSLAPLMTPSAAAAAATGRVNKIFARTITCLNLGKKQQTGLTLISLTRVHCVLLER